MADIVEVDEDEGTVYFSIVELKEGIRDIIDGMMKLKISEEDVWGGPPYKYGIYLDWRNDEPALLKTLLEDYGYTLQGDWYDWYMLWE